MKLDHEKKLEKNKHRLVSKLLTGLMFGVLVLVVFLLYGDLDEVSEVIVSFPVSAILLAIVLTLLSYLLRFVKWHFFLTNLKIPVSMKDSFQIFFIGLSMSITPGKVGELLKSYLLKKVSNVGMLHSAPAVFVDRITDMIAMLLLVLIGSTIFTVGYSSLILLVVVIVFLIFVLRSKKLSLFLIKMITSTKLLSKQKENIMLMYESAYALLKLRSLVIATAVSVLAWFMECLALYVLIKSVPLDLTIIHSIFIFSVGTVAGALSMLPGGLGVAEGSITGMFIYFGVERSMSVSIALIIRIVTLWLGVLIGLAIFFKTRKKFML